MAKQLRFKETALLAQETAAAEEEGKMQALLFSMLQEQHEKQMATMAASNKANMDTMMEKMNALVAADGGRKTHTNKENQPPAGTAGSGSGGGDVSKKPQLKKALCPNCKSFVYHSPDKCYELEANKASRYPGWKSVFAATPTT